MPLTSIVCPHCEHRVEVPTTSVTRSRECPSCGKNIILQLTSRDGRNPRKALLTVLRENADAGRESPGAQPVRRDPWPVIGGARDRLIFEPEVQSRIKQLQWGLVIAGAMILLVVGNYYEWWLRPVQAIVEAGHRLRAPLAVDTGDEIPAEPPPRTEIKTEPVSPAIQTPPVTLSATSPAPALAKVSVPAPDRPVAPGTPASLQLTDLETAKNAAITFLAAKNIDERIGLIRDRTLNEKRMRSYYEARGDGPVAYERIEARDVNLHGVFTYTFNVVLKDGMRRELLVGKARNGKFVVDWASFVLYSEMDWSEFRAKRPRAGVMFRLLAIPADFFQGEFSDSQDLLCLKLINPLQPDSSVLYGYARKSDSLGRTLKGITEKSFGQPQPMILKIAYPENGAADNQVLITEFIGEGWIARNW